MGKLFAEVEESVRESPLQAAADQSVGWLQSVINWGNWVIFPGNVQSYKVLVAQFK